MVTKENPDKLWKQLSDLVGAHNMSMVTPETIQLFKSVDKLYRNTENSFPEGYVCDDLLVCLKAVASSDASFLQMLIEHKTLRAFVEKYRLRLNSAASLEDVKELLLEVRTVGDAADNSRGVRTGDVNVRPLEAPPARKILESVKNSKKRVSKEDDRGRKKARREVSSESTLPGPNLPTETGHPHESLSLDGRARQPTVRENPLVMKDVPDGTLPSDGHERTLTSSLPPVGTPPTVPFRRILVSSNRILPESGSLSQVLLGNQVSGSGQMGVPPVLPSDAASGLASTDLNISMRALQENDNALLAVRASGSSVVPDDPVGSKVPLAALQPTNVDGHYLVKKSTAFTPNKDGFSVALGLFAPGSDNDLCGALDSYTKFFSGRSHTIDSKDDVLFNLLSREYEEVCQRSVKLAKSLLAAGLTRKHVEAMISNES
ncbi:uncharacterized protein EV420DRAFT_1521214 [Desarmillaria tabescens]|uniref:Uncharacterized protein n=1 Tax=Armillaria tabescens TaxID=1929756 RepID=A0AA39TKZ8_ARMTA|nr:uncharacterized protein EV420DRAFT_1521214 [Desarmillaria tabescens]KAK0462837.1 hypothetical protein EV420DRAFT_1521214 [Desarmillaria tabescens]